MKHLRVTSFCIFTSPQVPNQKTSRRVTLPKTNSARPDTKPITHDGSMGRWYIYLHLVDFYGIKIYQSHGSYRLYWLVSRDPYLMIYEIIPT